MKLEIKNGQESIETAKQNTIDAIKAKRKGIKGSDTASGAEEKHIDVRSKDEPVMGKRKHLEDIAEKRLEGMAVRDETDDILLQTEVEEINKEQTGGSYAEPLFGTYVQSKARRAKRESAAEKEEVKIIRLKEELAKDKESAKEKGGSGSSFDKKKKRREKKLRSKIEKKETKKKRYKSVSVKKLSGRDVARASIGASINQAEENTSDDTVRQRMLQAKRTSMIPGQIRYGASVIEKISAVIKRTILALKAVVSALLPILLPLIAVIVIVTIISSLLMIFDDEDEAEEDPLIPITIEGPYDGKKGELVLKGEGIEIKKIIVEGDEEQFSGKNKVKKNDDGYTARILPLPDKSSGARFTNGIVWMPRMVNSNYSKNLWEGYPGYKLANGQMPGKKLVKDSNGYARLNTKNGDYIVAVGSSYVPTKNVDQSIGKARYRATFVHNGKTKVLTATLGDTKADHHTDSKHQYAVGDGSIVELWSWDRSRSLVNPNTVFPGTLKKLELINSGAQQANLRATIKKKKNGKYKVIIKGDVDGTEVYTEGTWKDNYIKTDGWYGEGASSMGSGKLIWPAKKGWTWGRGWGLWTNTSRSLHIHQGIDITAPGGAGAPVLAMDSGIVVTPVTWANFRGWYMVVKHNNKLYTEYQHLSPKSKGIVKKGDRVRKGQQIARQGNSYMNSWGTKDYNSDDCGVHIHFEVYPKYPVRGGSIPWETSNKGETLDPLKLLPKASQVPAEYYTNMGKYK